MTQKKKLGDRVGVKEWQNLETAADIKRYLRWVVLSVRNGTMPSNVAGVCSQLALAMLKTMETHDFEKRMNELERKMQEQRYRVGNVEHPTVTH